MDNKTEIHVLIFNDYEEIKIVSAFVGKPLWTTLYHTLLKSGGDLIHRSDCLEERVEKAAKTLAETGKYRDRYDSYCDDLWIEVIEQGELSEMIKD